MELDLITYLQNRLDDALVAQHEHRAKDSRRDRAAAEGRSEAYADALSVVQRMQGQDVKRQALVRLYSTGRLYPPAA